MSLLKYFGEQNEDGHNGRLFWSGNLEAPFRGRSAPLLNRDEYDKLEIDYDAHVRVFDLGDPEELRQYEAILDRAANGGWYVVRHVEHHWDEARGTMKVYVEWFQKYSSLPPHMRSSGVPL